MTKKQQQVAEAVKVLKEWGLKDGTEVYGKVNNVSSSGMSRNIGLYFSRRGEIIDISYWAAKALEWPYREGFNGGVRVSGCGMDMIFHTISSLSYVMGYGDLCQERDRKAKIEKPGIDGKTIKAIGLKYRRL